MHQQGLGNFENSNFQGADFEGSDCTLAELVGAKLSEANLVISWNAQVMDCRMTSARILAA